MEKQPAPVNDRTILKIVNDSKKYTSLNDKKLCEMLQLFVLDKNLKFTMFIKTLLKPFNKWIIFLKVCKLYSLNDNLNPNTDVYQLFSCVFADLSSDE